MAIPTKTNLQTMDYSFFGEPYVQVASKSGVEVDGMEYSFFGTPVWFAEDGTAPPTSDDLTATSITSGIPALGTPTLMQKHALTGTAISAGIPTLSTPTLSQIHALTATAITSGIPTLGKPTITQTHILSATSITSGIPTLSTPSMSATSGLVANGITSGIPVLGTPAISQTHVLSATGITAGVPTLSTATIGQTHKLSATNITNDPAVLGAPAVTQTHVLSATAITSGTPVLGKPTISQTHILSANGITSGTPTLGSPEAGEGPDIQYTEVMAFTLKAFVTADFDVVLPNDTSVDVDVLGEVVSGAGSSEVNGRYLHIVGTDQWKKTDADIYIINTGFSYWLILSETPNYYIAVSDALTPDLVTNWTVGTDGVLPLPTIAVGVVDTIPTFGTLVSLTLEMPQTVTMTLYKELSK